MPELPEVETVVRGLRATTVGRTIETVRLFAPARSIQLGPSFARKRFGTILRHRTIEAVDRRGKNILIRLSDDITWWVHLKMTGRFYLTDQNCQIDRHDLIICRLAGPTKSSNHKRYLHFNDYRRFGRHRIFYGHELYEQPGLVNLGPEPLTLKIEKFVEICRRRPRMIKPALLDQTFIAGLGNIYADEALFASRIHPRRMTTSVSKPKLRELHTHIQRILRQAIQLMGSSVDTYSGIDGKPGSFQTYLKAYGREGKPCQRCGRSIVREKIGSRSAHYCLHCQRPGSRTKSN